MAHLRDIELIERSGGGLSAEARAEVDAHLAGCEQCADRYREVQAAWQVLGEWSEPAETTDLVSAVRQAAVLDRPDVVGRAPLSWRLWLGPVVRVAASVAVAAVLGHAAGLAVRPAQQVSMSPDTVDHELAATELYLDVLAEESPTGLITVILTSPTPDGEV